MKVLNYEGLQLYHNLASNEFANKEEVEQDITNLKDGKVDKENGKGLSTNDFTDEFKNKLENIINSTENEIIELLIQADAFPVVADADGNIMTDETGAILLI